MSNAVCCNAVRGPWYALRGRRFVVRSFRRIQLYLKKVNGGDPGPLSAVRGQRSAVHGSRSAVRGRGSAVRGSRSAWLAVRGPQFKIIPLI